MTVSSPAAMQQQQGSSVAAAGASTAAAAPPTTEDDVVVITEGRASISQRAHEVFYNPVQVVNRDLSVACLRVFASRRKAAANANRKHPRSGREDNGGDSRKGKGNKRKKEDDGGGGGEGNGDAGVPAPPPRSEPGEGSPAGGLRVLEGLAATGLRALRYALEVDDVDSVHATDLDASAVAAMRRNVELNARRELDERGDGASASGPPFSPRARKVHPARGDARLVMLANADCYDAVDLDPYGSPCTLLDAAVRAVGSGGLLCVTATDMAVLCGANPGSCYAKYASMPLHKPYGHEQALRILLASIETAAARAGRTIEPLLSASIDFYARVFVRVRAAPGAAKSLPLRLAHVYQSVGCDSFHLQKIGRDVSKPNRNGVKDPNNAKITAAPAPAVPSVECPHTGSRWAMGGPLWAGPLHDLDFVREVAREVAAVSREAKREEKRVESDAGGAPPPSPLVPVYQAAPRVLALLTSIAEELPDVPLYYSMHSLCRTLRCAAPPAETIRSAVLNAGYRVSGSHANPLALKTDAPPSVVWDIMRCWVAEHGGGGGAAKERRQRAQDDGDGESAAVPAGATSAEKILSVPPELKASFARAQGAAKPNGSGLALPPELSDQNGTPTSTSTSDARKTKVARFLPNPEPHWGPKARAGKGKKAQAQAERNRALAAAKESTAAEARERARGAEEAVAKRAERAAKAAAEAKEKELAVAK